MTVKIGLIGRGHVGSSLKTGWSKAGHDVRDAGKDAKAVAAVADWADVVVLAMPWRAVEVVTKTIRDLVDGKVVLDVTNPLKPNGELDVGHTTSGAEIIQEKLPSARIVKALNYVFATNMNRGKVRDQPLTAFVASEDQAARRTVEGLVKDLGFEPLPMAGLRHARELEAAAKLMISLAFDEKLGPGIGLHLVR